MSTLSCPIKGNRKDFAMNMILEAPPRINPTEQDPNITDPESANIGSY